MVHEIFVLQDFLTQMVQEKREYGGDVYVERQESEKCILVNDVIPK